MKEHPPATAEHLNVSVTGVAKPCHDRIPQGFFAAYPRHKTVHCFLSEAECKRKDRFAFPSAKRPHELFLFSVDLKEAHREYAHDAADKQTDEEGQHSVIPSSLW